MNSRAPFIAIVFAVSFAVAYLLAVWNNYALFTYHPQINEIDWGVQKSRDGPAMYWYGWISTAALAALGVSVVALLVPARIMQRLWSGWTWVVAVGVLLAFTYHMKNYFLR